MLAINKNIICKITTVFSDRPNFITKLEYKDDAHFHAADTRQVTIITFDRLPNWSRGHTL